MEEYNVSESDGVVTLCASVLEGSIGTNVTIEVSTNSGSALCECMLYYGALIFSELSLYSHFRVFLC